MASEKVYLAEEKMTPVHPALELHSAAAQDRQDVAVSILK
jgi:hypothetical protein